MTNLETLLIVFIAVTAVAVVIQMGVLVALYAAVKKSSTRMETLAGEVQARVLPALDTAQSMITAYRPKIDVLLDNVTETSNVVRRQVASIEEPIAEAIQCTRQQVARIDELVSRTLDRVEQTSQRVQQTVSGPVRQASGIVQGLSAGLATLLGRSPSQRTKKSATAQKDEMFI